MNRTVLRLAVSAVALLSSAATLADTMDMTVRARVNGACRMVTAPLVNFGILNQVAAPDLTLAAVNVQYRCTKDLAPSAFKIGNSDTGTYGGTLTNTTDSNYTIPYQLTWSTTLPLGNGMAPGQEVDVPVVGTMTGTDYQNVAAGIYQESVTIEVLP